MTTFARRNSQVIEVEAQNEPLTTNQESVMNRRDKNDGKQILADRVLLHKDCRPRARRLLAFGVGTNERMGARG